MLYFTSNKASSLVTTKSVMIKIQVLQNKYILNSNKTKTPDSLYRKLMMLNYSFVFFCKFSFVIITTV